MYKMVDYIIDLAGGSAPYPTMMLKGKTYEVPCPYCGKDSGYTSLCCADHLRSIYGLEIKPSTKPECGLGLFATRDFPARAILARSQGELLTKRQLKQRYKSNVDTLAPYTMSAGIRSYVDELVVRSPVAYANDAMSMADYREFCRQGIEPRWAYHYAIRKDLENAGLFMCDGIRPVMYTRRAIAAGEEIMWKYGSSYWRER